MPPVPDRRSGRSSRRCAGHQPRKQSEIYISLVMVPKGNLGDSFSKLFTLPVGKITNRKR